MFEKISIKTTCESCGATRVWNNIPVDVSIFPVKCKQCGLKIRRGEIMKSETDIKIKTIMQEQVWENTLFYAK